MVRLPLVNTKVIRWRKISQLFTRWVNSIHIYLILYHQKLFGIISWKTLLWPWKDTMTSEKYGLKSKQKGNNNNDTGFPIRHFLLSFFARGIPTFNPEWLWSRSDKYLNRYLRRYVRELQLISKKTIPSAL